MYRRYGEFTAEDRIRIVERVFLIQALFLQLKTSRVAPEIREGLKLDSAKVELAVGAYWNDLIRIKAVHDIKGRLHRSKVAAYGIKWLVHLQPVYCVYTPEEIKSFPENAQHIVYNVNLLLAVQFLFRVLDELNPADFGRRRKYERVLNDLYYYLATGQYSEKMASVLFETLAINSSRRRR